MLFIVAPDIFDPSPSSNISSAVASPVSLEKVLTGSLVPGEKEAPGQVSYTVGLIFVVLFSFLLGTRLKRMGNHAIFADKPWRMVLYHLIADPFPLFCATSFTLVFTQIVPLPEASPIPLFRSLLSVCLVILWARTLIRNACVISGLPMPLTLLALTRFLLIFSLIFGCWVVLVEWILSENSFLLFPGRVAFSIYLLFFAVLFWRGVEKMGSYCEENGATFYRILKLAGTATALSIGYGGLLLDSMGYGKLAHFYYVAWGRSAVPVIWGVVTMMLIREWKPGALFAPKGPGETPDARQTVSWFFSRLAWLLWFNAVGLAIIFAWGADRTVVGVLYSILSYPATVGGLHISILSLVYAVILFFATHTLIRLFKHFFRYRVLADSGIETGVAQSMTALISWGLWGIGILFILSILGVSSGSLTVAFGAIGIGLGFGLQNIFNNFISGIILLFERPIQVGDAIEVDGIWGEVRKINVRSTVVQTYDNASFIIPNSDLITTKLTNWSFKDLRIRRSIVVGVAYGSDLNLVKTTLLGIANRHERVLKKPAPDCLFLDFGDSSLVFKLRFWSYVDWFLQVESELRFHIDQEFKEKSINIPFPQRDVWMRSEPATDESGANTATDGMGRE